MQVLPSMSKSSETLSTDVDDTNTNNKPTAPPRVKSGSSLKSDTNSRPNTAHNNKYVLHFSFFQCQNYLIIYFTLFFTFFYLILFCRIPKSLSQSMGITSDEEDEESTPIIRKEIFYRFKILQIFQISCNFTSLQIFLNILKYWILLVTASLQLPATVYILAY